MIFVFVRNKTDPGQTTQETRTECEDRVDSAEPGGLSRDTRHITLPQVANLGTVRPPVAHIQQLEHCEKLSPALGSKFDFVVSFLFKLQDHVDLGLCLEESKEGVVVKSLIHHGTASKV